MNNDDPRKAVLVVILVALVCSFLVSASIVLLAPIKQENEMLVRGQNILSQTGWVEQTNPPDREAMLLMLEKLDSRLLDINESVFSDAFSIEEFNERRAASNPQTSHTISSEFDTAGLGRRSRYVVVHLIWSNEKQLQRIILPVYGAGMWSTLYGYIALDATDFNTVASALFYEQAETPGLGDKIEDSGWLAQWQGRKIYNTSGRVSFRVAEGRVEPGTTAAVHQVDGLTGATVTASAVTNLVQYWFGKDGYLPFLQSLNKTKLKPAGGLSESSESVISPGIVVSTGSVVSKGSVVSPGTVNSPASLNINKEDPQ